MANRSPEVDAYIAKAPEYARPILEKLRGLFHKACPQIEEGLKWSCPHFEHKGMIGGMAAFKQHATFGFWKGSLFNDPHGVLCKEAGASMCNVKITSLADLPSDKVLLDLIRQAVALNEMGVKAPSKKKKARKPLPMPPYFRAALKKNKKAQATFDAFSPSHQREYIEWITEAKQEATRDKRLATALEWLAEGKPRNWKYMK